MSASDTDLPVIQFNYNIHGSCGIKTRSNMDEKGKMEGELKSVGAF